MCAKMFARKPRSTVYLNANTTTNVTVCGKLVVTTLWFDSNFSKKIWFEYDMNT